MLKNKITLINRPVLIALIIAGSILCSTVASADNTLVGLNTDGTVYDINVKTGALTQKAQEALTSFSLGPITRRKGNLFYVAAPSGSSENAIFKVVVNTGAISHVDLDRSDDDDEARALFFKGSKLYGVFYNGTAGTAGVYSINPTTGATRQIVDLSTLDLEPIGGAFARIGNFFFMLAKPESDSTQRRLIRFKARSGSAKVFNVATSNGVPVLCDRLKLNYNLLNFVCLASPSTTQVDVCRLGLTGRATCVKTLSDVERLAGGHTMITPNGKAFYAFVYAPGDSSAQRLIKFNAKGIVKSTNTINTIIIGAKFGHEDDEPVVP